MHLYDTLGILSLHTIKQLRCKKDEWYMYMYVAQHVHLYERCFPGRCAFIAVAMQWCSVLGEY